MLNDARSSSDSERIRVGKVAFHVSTPPEAVDRVIHAAQHAEAISVRLSNAYCVALASKDPSYEELLNSPGLTFPDGTPVVWFMKKRAEPEQHPSCVRGPSLFRNTIDVGRRHSLRHFFLGTTDETLAALTARLTHEFPGLIVSGAYSPPFAPLNDKFYADCIARIAETDAQIIWVALGTPKQDYVAETISKMLGKPCIAVGAAFDFAAGTASEAPRWIQNTGMEWIYRLATEPKRLWKRYLFGNSRFLRSALTESNR